MLASAAPTPEKLTLCQEIAAALSDAAAHACGRIASPLWSDVSIYGTRREKRKSVYDVAEKAKIPHS